MDSYKLVVALACTVATLLPQNGFAQYVRLSKIWQPLESKLRYYSCSPGKRNPPVRKQHANDSESPYFQKWENGTERNLMFGNSRKSPAPQKRENRPAQNQWIDEIDLKPLEQSTGNKGDSGSILIPSTKERALVLPKVSRKPTTDDQVRDAHDAPNFGKLPFLQNGLRRGESPLPLSEDRMRHRQLMRSAAKRHSLDSRFVAALIRAESNWNPAAVSPKDARGLMQLMPATAERLLAEYRVELPRERLLRLLHDPTVNVRLGTRLLANLFQTFRPVKDPSRRQVLVLASYNAGEKWVERAFRCRANECPRKINSLSRDQFAEQLRRLPRETRGYIERVNRFHRQSAV